MKRTLILAAAGLPMLTACGSGSDVADAPATVSVANDAPSANETVPGSADTTGVGAIGAADSSDAEVDKGFLFTSPLGDYTVSYPAEPSVQDLPIPLGDQTVTAQAYVLGTSTGSAYFSSAFDFPPELAEPDVLVALEGARDGAIANTGATLESSELIKRDGYRGIAFTFSVDDDDRQGVGTAVVFYENPRLFQSFAVGPVEEQSSYEAFVDSFEFINALEAGS